MSHHCEHTPSTFSLSLSSSFFCLATKAMARVQEQKQSITTLQTQIERESQAMQHCSEASDKLLHLQHKAILLGEEAQYVETLLPAFATHTHTHTQRYRHRHRHRHRHTDTQTHAMTMTLQDGRRHKGRNSCKGDSVCTRSTAFLIRSFNHTTICNDRRHQQQRLQRTTHTQPTAKKGKQ